MTITTATEGGCGTDCPPPFVRTGPETFVAQSTAEGPWSPGFCHGGAPAALVAHVVDGVEPASTMQIARVTINLMRPVPVAELRLASRVIREGRNIQLLEVTGETTHGSLVIRAEVLRVRQEATPDAENVPPCSLAGSAEGIPTGPPTGVGFSRLFEMRAVEGRFETPGPAAVWFKMHGELVAGEPTGAVARALACADFASGIGAAVQFEKWSYPNADLTVSFAREPRSGWVLVDAESWIGSEGRGVAHARLGDADGWFGRSVQSALIIRRSTA